MLIYLIHLIYIRECKREKKLLTDSVHTLVHDTIENSRDVPTRARRGAHFYGVVHLTTHNSVRLQIISFLPINLLRILTSIILNSLNLYGIRNVWKLDKNKIYKSCL